MPFASSMVRDLPNSGGFSTKVDALFKPSDTAQGFSNRMVAQANNRTAKIGKSEPENLLLIRKKLLGQ